MTFRASNGSAVHFEESGTGPAILCLHGLGGGAYFFEEFAARLADRYRICAVDLPGTGASTTPESLFSMEGWVETFGELLADYFRSKVVLLGHSMSVILGLKLYGAYPDRISSLVLVGGLPEVRPFIRERLSKRRESVAKNGMAGLGKVAAPGIFSPKTLRDQPQLIARFEKELEAMRAETYLRCIEILLGATAAELVPRIQAPCLVVSGSDDQYAPPENISEFSLKLPSLKRQVVIPECGHMPFLEAPDEFAKIVREF